MRSQKNPPSKSPYRYSEDGAAARFTDEYGDYIRFVHTVKKWLIWTDGEWKWDDTLGVQNLIRQICRLIATEASIDSQLNGAQRAQIAQRFSSGRITYGIELLLRCDPVHSYAFPNKGQTHGNPIWPPIPQSERRN